MRELLDSKVTTKLSNSALKVAYQVLSVTFGITAHLTSQPSAFTLFLS